MTFDASSRIRAALSSVEVEKKSLFRNMFRDRGPVGLHGIAEQVEAENQGGVTYMPYDDSDDQPAWRYQPRTTEFNSFADEDDPELLQGFNGPARDRENYVNHRLIDRWKRTGSEEDLEKLYGRYSGMLEGVIRSVSRRKVPEPAVRGRVYNTFKTALDTYDPSKGAQFHSWLDLQNRGVRNWASQNQNFAKVPKSRASKQEAFRVAFEQFEQEHGREPTAREMKNELPEYKSSEIRMMLQEKDRVLASSMNLQREYAYNESRLMEQAVREVRDSLPQNEQKFFDDYLAQHGKTLGITTSTAPSFRPGRGFKSELGQRYGLSSVQVSRRIARYRGLLSQEIQRLERSNQ